MQNSAMVQTYLLLGGEIRPGNVKCILPGHGGSDHTPSAKIFSDGLYYCFKCSKFPLDEVGLVSTCRNIPQVAAREFLLSKNIVPINKDRMPREEYTEVALLTEICSCSVETGIYLTQAFYQHIINISKLETLATFFKGEK